MPINVDLTSLTASGDDAYHEQWPAGNAPVGPRAFPGAEGLAAETRGAAGHPSPQVVFVDNLNDSGAGSFREAVAGTGKDGRFVIFRVSGIINLLSPLSILSSQITILFHTSPSGICFAGNVIEVGNGSSQGHGDIILRHMRHRAGYFNVASPNDAEAFRIWGGHDIYVDRPSFSWGGDETISVTTYGGAVCSNITFNRPLIAEGLADAVFPDTGEGDHGYGFLFNGTYQNGNSMDMIRPYFAHCNSRMPQLAGAGDFTIINPVIYNFWRSQNMNLIPDSNQVGLLRVNLIGAYFKRGADSNENFANGGNASEVIVQGEVQPNYTTGVTPSEMLYQDNCYGTNRILDSDPEWQAADGFSASVISTAWRRSTRFDYPATHKPIEYVLNQDNLEQFLQTIVSDAGASVPVRDSVDVKLINDAINGTGAIRANASYPSDWPTFGNNPYPTDSDGDGIPDSYWTFAETSPKPWNELVTSGKHKGYLWIEAFSDDLEKERFSYA